MLALPPVTAATHRAVVKVEQHDALCQQREDAIATACDLIESLVLVVNDAVEADGKARAIASQMRTLSLYPADARDRLVRQLHGRLSALRPYVPHTTDPGPPRQYTWADVAKDAAAGWGEDAPGDGGALG